jgi:hypothetical protein
LPPSIIIQQQLAMALGHLYSSTLNRLLRPTSSPSAAADEYDLADLEESFRNPSFALVPSALTPSRASSNSLIAATRALFFNSPVCLDFPAGWGKGPVTDWYNEQRAKGSTVIEKIQLRKDYQHPYYHEYIIITIRSGLTYRIDRRPDPDAPFDTIMKNGCTAHDSIQEVDSELDNTSSCVVELHWQSESEESIDISFVLSICFAIRNDKWADRYTLQRYNCYFLSWAIVAIIMRKSAVCGAAFSTGIMPSCMDELERALELELERTLEWVLALEAEREARVPSLEAKRAYVRARVRVRELAEELARGLGRELVWYLAPRREQGDLALRGELVGELVGELGRDLGRDLARDLGRELVREWARDWTREWVREWAQEWARKWAWEWTRGLGQIPLMLELWRNPAFAKIVSSRQVVFMISLLYGLIYSNIAWRA